ncbi:hypothetical protein ASALC70_03317 [Alcanivorax sp. ALC70]|nr:hypothetical protein ASALC70_03317 [Alcanivorax sp. ALC70]
MPGPAKVESRARLWNNTRPNKPGDVAMNALLKLFARLCVFRSGPEDMPYIPPLLALMLAVWLALQMLAASLQAGLTLAQMVGVQLISLTVLAGATTAVLGFKQLLERWVQTMMALLGVDILLTLVALPLLLIGHAMGGTPPFVDGLYLIVVSWQLAIQSFIFHRAFAVGPLLGLALAFGLLILTFMVVSGVMPEAMQAG